MPYVTVPKDFKNVKNKVMLGMDKRQLILGGIGLIVCFALFWILKRIMGLAALYVIAVLFIPFVAAGWYKHRDGRPLEAVLRNYIKVRYIRPQYRPYMTENIYRNINLSKQISEVIENANANEKNKKDKKARPIQRAAKGRKKKDKSTGKAGEDKRHDTERGAADDSI